MWEVARSWHYTTLRGSNKKSPKTGRWPVIAAQSPGQNKHLPSIDVRKEKVLGIHFFRLSPYQTMP
jgi:hypothetical protein